jgi:hypothetical protein
MFGCAKPTAEKYSQRYKAAANLPIEKMVVEMDIIDKEAEKNLSIEEYVRFCQQIAEIALDELRNVNEKSMEEYERTEKAIGSIK